MKDMTHQIVLHSTQKIKSLIPAGVKHKIM
jgi:hypothetical protein